MPNSILIKDDELKKSAVSYRKDLLIMPVLSANDTLQHMTPRAGVAGREVLGQLLVLLAPFAPHVTEELWHSALGNDTTICDAAWPVYDEKYLKEDTVNYAVSFNGKARFTITVAADTDRAEVERLALSNEAAAKWLDGKQVVKVIVVPRKIVNIVVK